jgi:uncharacterized protein (TIGR03086 family)
MTGTESERFRRVAAGFTERVRAVPPDAWDRPAPCEGWQARHVVRHLVEWPRVVFARAGLDLPTEPPVDDDPLGAWLAVAEMFQSALDDPAVAARRFDAGPPGEMTIEQAIGSLVTGDVLVHTWDLARATGQDDTLDPVVASEMLRGMEPIDELLRSSGHFGPRVLVADDADVQTRLIAFTGRDPDFGR